MKGKTTISLVLLVVLWLQVCQVGSWRRRRRRRNPIPPPQNCQVSSWGSWSACSSLCSTGTQYKTRHVTVSESWGGSCPYDLQMSRSCGSHKNGCTGPGSLCNPSNGNCYCSSGYYLLSGGKTCADTNECTPNSGKGLCDQVCSNTDGSYKCSCNAGYSLSGRHACTPLDCHAFTLPSCPSNSYQDQFSNVCNKVQSSCPSGTTYLQYCSLSCSNDYSLAKISSQPGKMFGKSYQSVDFSSVKSTVTCVIQQGGSGVHWDTVQDLSSYFCRRNNDPPFDIILTGTTLQEHAASGTIVGSLSSKDQQQGQTFTYTVLSPSMLFTCQGQSLKSTWKDPNLHGSIPLVNGSIQLRIRSTDNGSPQMWHEKTFSIKIQDVNDPPLNITLTNQDILENATIGSVVGVLYAVDGDAPPGTQPSSDFIWNLTDSSNGKFSLSGAKVEVAQPLNHEAAKIHQIKVTCTDRGTHPASSEKTFVVNVLDLNEPPASLTLSSSSIPENSPVGTVVGVLKAMDEDNDIVFFNISQSNPVTLSKFTLGSKSFSKIRGTTTYQADIKVKGDLDYEDRKSFQLVVQANDISGQIVKEWTLSVDNVNEKPTSVNLTDAHTVDENSPTGTIVGEFMVTDPDNLNSDTQTHTCRLENSQSGDNDYFIIGSSTVLKVKGGATVIDYETNKVLSITVRCTDSGNPSMSVVRIFNITVRDVNEPPTSLTLSNLTIPENSPIGAIVGTLSSDDPEKSYQTYRYSIEGQGRTPFVLGGPEGTTVIVNGTLDFEKKRVLDLVVRVTDSGGLFKEETFKIRLIDKNDPPTDIILPGLGGRLAFKENSGENVLISNIELADEDQDDPTCALVNNAAHKVKLLRGKHLVVGTTKTDYESSVGKELKIKLNCSDGHNAFVSKSFNIKIIDVNEPVIDITVSNLTVPENQANAMIGIVTVVDYDIGQLHVCMVCDVIHGDSCPISQYFVVNAAMELKTKKELNFEAQHSYKIKINCSDVVTPQQKSLSKEESYRITVKDVNEQPSSVCQSPFHMSVDDSNGAIIATLQAVDPDNEGNSSKQTLVYSTNVISDAPFRLKDSRIFKYKNISEPYNFTIDIKVTDDGQVVSGFTSNGFKYSRQSSLSRVFTCVVIASNSKPSTIVNLNPNTISVMATDRTVIGTLTSNLVESLTYKLLNYNQLPFAIEENKLKVKQTVVEDYVDFENKKDLFTYIEVETVGNVSGTVTSGLYVHIINDAPKVPMCLVKTSLGENTPLQTIVGQLLIEDSTPPKYSCSETSCCSQVNNIQANTFHYQCIVNNPNENTLIASNNVTNMFYMDERYLLRSKKIFNYDDYLSTGGSIVIRISCHDTIHPLHFIGKNFTVNILDCSSNGECPAPPECGHCYNGGTCQDREGSYTCLCQSGYTGNYCKTDIDYCEENLCKNGGTCQDLVKTFNCSCMTGYSGVLCDRNSNLCGSCDPDTICVKFTDAGMRCLSEGYQVPVLVNGQTLTEQQLWEIEQEIAGLVDENKEKLSVSNRKRRSASTFYVETLKIEAVTDKTLLRLAILDSRNDYNPLAAKDACAVLSGTNKHCVDKDDCGLIKDSGKACPVIPNNLGHSGTKTNAQGSGLGSGGSAGVALGVVLVILVILIGAIYYYRRKYRQAKQDEQSVVNYNAGDENIEFSNQSYDNPEMIEEMARDRIAKETLVGVNLDHTSVRKRNDIKVTENVLYCAPERDPSTVLSAQNVLYVSGEEARNPKMVNVDDEKPKNVNNIKPGKEPMYEELDAVKNNIKKIPEDFDPAKEKMKVRMNSDEARGAAYEEWDPKIHGKHNEEKSNNQLSEDNRPRYEESPISFKRKDKGSQHKNTSPLTCTNPIYENSLVQPGKDGGKHVYDNVEMKKPEDIVSGQSILNPVYEQSIVGDTGDLASGDSGSRLEDPLYEVIPEKGKKTVDEKARRKSFLRSVSSEKAGYEALKKTVVDDDKEEHDDAFGNSHA